MINKNSQQGATLIVVLVILVLIILVSTLAIRQGILSLNIATNAQAQQLMNQSSDAALFHAEDVDQLTTRLAANGMFGYIRTSSNKGKELVFCYRGTNSNFFSLNNASILKWEDGKTSPTNNELGTAGYCSLNNSNDYTSGRSAVMTQVAVQFIESSSSTENAFAGSVMGTDVETAKVISPETAIITAVSLMPTLSKASNTQINACLSTHMTSPSSAIPTGISAVTDTVTNTSFGTSVSECLSTLGVPYSTYVTVYNLTQSVVGS